MAISKEDHKYDDMIGLPHHISPKRQRMSNYDRAAQFSPFAALTGYDAVITETGRLTDEPAELTEGSKEALDEKLRQLREVLSTQPEVTVTYFRFDERKAGGAYLCVTGQLKKIDTYHQWLLLTDGTAIPIDQVYGIESPLLR